MAIKHQNVTVGTVAVDLVSSITDGNDRAEIERSVSIQNLGPGDIKLGGTGVTTSSYGFLLAAGSATAFDLVSGDVLFAIADTAGNAVNLLHLGV